MAQCTNAHIAFRAQPVGVGSLLPPSGFRPGIELKSSGLMADVLTISLSHLAVLSVELF